MREYGPSLAAKERLGRHPHVMVGWLTDEAFLWLSDHYVLTEISRENAWAYLHPFAKLIETRVLDKVGKP